MKLRTAIGISLILVILTAAAYFLIVRAPSAATKQLAEQIRAEFAKTFQFQPEIRTRTRTLLGQTKAVLELATARKEIQEQHRLEHEWMGSVKVFEIEGRFAGRAGYDLLEPISLQLDSEPKIIHVTLPPARLLGLELAGIRITADADGWWNKLTAQDREAALADLQNEARKKIEASDLIPLADANFRTALRELLQRSAPDYTVEFHDAAPGKH